MQKHFYRLIASAAAAAITVAQLTASAQVASAKKEKEPVSQTSESSDLESVSEAAKVVKNEADLDASKGVDDQDVPDSDELDDAAEPIIVTAELISSETQPEEEPTEAPSTEQITEDTSEPTAPEEPTEEPTDAPTEEPSEEPTEAPVPSEEPTEDTTEAPTDAEIRLPGTPTKSDFSYLGAVGTLTETQTAEVAELIYQALKNHETKVDILNNVSEPLYVNEDKDSLSQLYQTVVYSCREGLLADLGYRYTNYQSETDYRIIDMTLTYKVPDFMYEDEYIRIGEKLDAILANVNPDWSAPELALYFHDYMAVYYNYDYASIQGYGEEGYIVDAGNQCFTAYGLLDNRVAVCQGYAWLYNVLLNECGVESYVITSAENAHAWNAVVIGGSYYQVDVTWDDSGQLKTMQYGLSGQVDHANFMKSSAGMILSGHSNNEDDWFLSNGERINDMPTSNEYVNGFWVGSKAAIYPYQGGWLVKTPDPENQRAASYVLYTYDFENNEAEWVRQAASEADVWYADLERKSRYGDNYSVCAVEDDIIYYTTNSGVLAVVHREGGGMYDYVWEWLFGLSEEEAQNGYIFGMRIEGDKMYYQVTSNLANEPVEYSRDMAPMREQARIAGGAPAGDLDGDFEVTVTDVVSMYQCLSGVKEYPSDSYKKRADLVEDGVLDVFDLSMLKRLVLNQQSPILSS